MKFLNFKRPEVARQAASLTLAVWAFTFVLFLAPWVVKTGHLPPIVVGYAVAEICLGILLSIIPYCVATLMEGKRPLYLLPAMAFAICAVALCFSLFDASLYSGLLQIFMEAYKIPPDVLSMTVSNFISVIWLYGLLGSVYVVLQTGAAIRERDIQLLQVQSLAQAAQLSALRLQLNPHFLFNTLNAISSLVMNRRTHEGEMMLDKLSAFLRTALSQDMANLITVGEELETLQIYLEIEAVRFGDRLTLEFECPRELLDAEIPCFILQPLVENAVKHAVAPTTCPVTILVSIEQDGSDLVISVIDTVFGPRMRRQTAGFGIGQSNARSRLDVLFGAEGTLTSVEHDHGFTAILRYPLSFDARALAA